MPRCLTIPERIKLFKEINRVHKAIYGWKMIYENASYGSGRIDIEDDIRLGFKGRVPISESEAGKYYFRDDKGKDILLLRGIFDWQAYYFSHLNPYKYHEHNQHKLTKEDLVFDSLGRRIRLDIGHPVECLKTMIEVQQRKDDGKIWISSNWLYHYDCYGTTEGVGGDIYKTLGEAAGGDEKVSKGLQEKYEKITDVSGYEFEKVLESYFRGGKLRSKYWYGGYLFAASKEWRIKTLEQFNDALAAEEKCFSDTLEEFIEWFRNNGLSLGAEAEESLRRRMRSYYVAYPCNIARDWCKLLVEEDKVEPSDVYLWWGGEPNSDSCYALLTLFFEVDPDDIGTPRFDVKISRNLRALIDIAGKDTTWLSSYREYEPRVWEVIFS